MSTEQEIKLIGLDKFNVLDKVKTIIPDFQITGSISLLICNIIDRPVGDIDLVIDDLRLLDNFKKHNISVEHHYDYDFEIQTITIYHKGVNGNPKIKDIKLPNRASVNIDDVNVCFFVRKDLKCFSFSFITGCRNFKITDPKYTISSKINYVKNYNDLELENYFEFYCDEDEISIEQLEVNRTEVKEECLTNFIYSYSNSW